MKKIKILVSIIFSVSVFAANGQNIYFGVNGGYLKNAMLTDDQNPVPEYLRDVRYKTLLNNYTWGINLGYNYNTHWSFETQLQFTRIAYKERLELLYDYHDDSVAGSKLAEVDQYQSCKYIRVPLLAHYKFYSSASGFRIGVLAGPSLGFMTGQSSKYKGVNAEGIEVANTLETENRRVKKTDIGFHLGIRIQAPVSRSVNIFFDGAVYQGFVNIIDRPNLTYDQPTPYYYNENTVNRHFTANIGLQFNLAAAKKTPL